MLNIKNYPKASKNQHQIQNPPSEKNLQVSNRLPKGFFFKWWFSQILLMNKRRLKYIVYTKYCAFPKTNSTKSCKRENNFSPNNCSHSMQIQTQKKNFKHKSMLDQLKCKLCCTCHRILIRLLKIITKYLSGSFCHLTVTFQFKWSVSNFNYI